MTHILHFMYQCHSFLHQHTSLINTYILLSQDQIRALSQELRRLKTRKRKITNPNPKCTASTVVTSRRYTNHSFPNSRCNNIFPFKVDIHALNGNTCLNWGGSLVTANGIPIVKELDRIGVGRGFHGWVTKKWGLMLDEQFRLVKKRDPRVLRLCVKHNHYMEGRLGRKKECVHDSFQVEYRNGKRFRKMIDEGISWDFIELYNGMTHPLPRFRAEYKGIGFVDNDITITYLDGTKFQTKDYEFKIRFGQPLSSLNSPATN